MAEVEAEKEEEVAVGAYLKGVREQRGLTLDEASKVTKVSKSYLTAIEEGEFSKLPNPAYIKGFLRLYAAFLSLSGDEIVQRYERSLPPPAARPTVEEKSPKGPGIEIVERAKLRGPGRWVLPAFLLGLVILAAVIFSENEEKPVRRPPPPAPAAVPAAAPAPVAAPQAVQPPRSSAQQAPAAAPQTAPAASPQTPAATPPAADQKRGGVVLKLRFTKDSALGITIDDSITQHYDLKAGDVIEWKGNNSFVVDLGDGGAVEAEYNGRPLKLGEAGKPAHVELKGP